MTTRRSDWISHLAMIALAAALAGSCGAIEERYIEYRGLKIPIQATRADIVIHYTQTYKMEHFRDDHLAAQTGSRLLAAVLGPQNFCNIDRRNRCCRISHLFEGEHGWTVHGITTAIFSPSPWFPDGFFISAHGQYVVQDEQGAALDRNQLLASADFWIESQSVYDVKSLLEIDAVPGVDRSRLRWIDLLISQIVVREIDIDRPRYAYPAKFAVRLYVLPLDRQGVFMIAPVKHEIGLVAPDGTDANVYSVGCIDLGDAAGGNAVFDVRGRDSPLRANDYGPMLQRAGIGQGLHAFGPRWFGRSCAADERHPAYRLDSARSAEEWIPDPEGTRLRSMFAEPACVVNAARMSPKMSPQEFNSCDPKACPTLSAPAATPAPSKGRK